MNTTEQNIELPTSNTEHRTNRPTAEQKKLIDALHEIALTTAQAVADIFVTWSPHCNSLHLDFHRGGWAEGVDKTWGDWAYLTHDDGLEGLQRMYDRITSELRGIDVEKVREERIQAERDAQFNRIVEAFIPSAEQISEAA